MRQDKINGTVKFNGKKFTTYLNSNEINIYDLVGALGRLESTSFSYIYGTNFSEKFFRELADRLNMKYVDFEKEFMITVEDSSENG